MTLRHTHMKITMYIYIVSVIYKLRELTITIHRVSNTLKNISQLGWLFPICEKIKNVPVTTRYLIDDITLCFFVPSPSHPQTCFAPVLLGCCDKMCHGSASKPQRGERGRAELRWDGNMERLPGLSHDRKWYKKVTLWWFYGDFMVTYWDFPWEMGC